MARKHNTLILDDMAKNLGLSKSTVSRAISGNGRVSEQTRRRVIQYAEQHGYAPNSIASSLARSQTNNLGVIMPTEALANEIPFFHECLMGVCEAAAKANYDVLITTVCENDISALKRIVNKRKVDGILLACPPDSNETMRFLHAVQMPFVCICRAEDTPPDREAMRANSAASCETLIGLISGQPVA